MNGRSKTRLYKVYQGPIAASLSEPAPEQGDVRAGYGGGAHSAELSREAERVKRGSEPRYVVHVDDYQDVPTVRDLARWIERTGA